MYCIKYDRQVSQICIAFVVFVINKTFILTDCDVIPVISDSTFMHVLIITETLYD